MTELDSIRAALQTEEDVLVAWVFGSHARGQAGPLSDIDLAVITRHPDQDDLVAVGARICGRLGTDAVDLVELETAPIPLAFRIVKEGVLLVDRAPGRRMDTVRRVLCLAHDYLPVWERILEESARAARSLRHGD